MLRSRTIQEPIEEDNEEDDDSDSRMTQSNRELEEE